MIEGKRIELKREYAEDIKKTIKKKAVAFEDQQKISLGLVGNMELIPIYHYYYQSNASIQSSWQYLRAAKRRFLKNEKNLQDPSLSKHILSVETNRGVRNRHTQND